MSLGHIYDIGSTVYSCSLLSPMTCPNPAYPFPPAHVLPSHSCPAPRPTDSIHTGQKWSCSDRVPDPNHPNYFQMRTEWICIQTIKPASSVFCHLPAAWTYQKKEGISFWRCSCRPQPQASASWWSLVDPKRPLVITVCTVFDSSSRPQIRVTTQMSIWRLTAPSHGAW